MATNVWWRCAHFLSLPLVARCLETKDVCIWRVFDCIFVYVYCRYCAGIFVVFGLVKDSVFSLGVLKYVACLCKGCDRRCVFCLY